MNFTVLGLNILMYRAKLLETTLYVNKLDQQNGTGFITIVNSTLGTMKVSEGFDISMSDSYIDGTIRHGSTHMDLKDCNLNIRRSSLYMLDRDFFDSVIYMVNCKVHILDVNLTSGFGTLIWGMESSIQMNNVYLSNVDISITQYSSLNIIHSHFEGKSSISIRDYCNMTMNNTTVEHQTFPFLHITMNGRINILNCTFNNISSLVTASQSFVFIDNNSINQCLIKYMSCVTKTASFPCELT